MIIHTSTGDPKPSQGHREFFAVPCCGAYMKSLLFLVLVGTILLSACGGSDSNRNTQIPVTLSGNWQFTPAPPGDGSFSGGLQGGFLLQKSTGVTGAVSYSITLPTNPNPTVCSNGSASVTGTLNGQAVTLTATTATQTFAFTGTLSLDGTTMGGTYTSTDGAGCGTAQTGLQWSAILVPPLTGSIQGDFHSAGGTAGLNQQVFVVSGGLVQSTNTGADSAVVTGNLNFVNAATDLSDYPCFATAALSGQISGNTVVLQILGTGGSNAGQIGQSTGSSMGLSPVNFTAARGANLLQTVGFLQSIGTAYLVATSADQCMGTLGTTTTAGDFGSLCLALNGSNGCQQALTLTPSALTFSSQTVGSIATMQTTTLVNSSGSSLGSLTLTVANNGGAADFTETDTCGSGGIASQGQPFNLGSGQSCVITISFAPVENCAPGTVDAQCLTATLIVTSPSDQSIFSLPIVGGVTPSAALTGRLDLDGKVLWEAVDPHWLSGNTGRYPVQALSASSRRERGTQ